MYSSVGIRIVVRYFFYEDTRILCKECVRGGPAKGKTAVDKSVKYKCCGVGCSSDAGQKEWFDTHFLHEHLTHAEARGETAKCARCVVAEDSSIHKLVECKGCGEKKQVKEYSAILCRQFLHAERREHIWKCYECQYPECCVPGCKERPPGAVSHNHVEADGRWFCHNHRYPPCSVCRLTPRPPSTCNGKIKFKEWTCAICQTTGGAGARNATASTTASGEQDASAGPSPTIAEQDAGAGPSPSGGATATHKQITCKKCADAQPEENFRQYDNRHRSARCLACEFPQCAACKRQRKQSEGPVPVKGVWYSPTTRATDCGAI